METLSLAQIGVIAILIGVAMVFGGEALIGAGALVLVVDLVMALAE